MAEVYANNGTPLLVDEEDHAWASQFKWGVCQGYARRYEKLGPRKYKAHLMHREIMGASAGEPEVDHKNGNRQDNRRENLRWATDSEQKRNSRGWKNSSSRFKGVSRINCNDGSRGGKQWRAAISVGALGEKKDYHLGCYETEEAAARAYDVAAVKHFGEFARTNFGRKGSDKVV